IRDFHVARVQTCALPICVAGGPGDRDRRRAAGHPDAALDRARVEVPAVPGRGPAGRSPDLVAAVAAHRAELDRPDDRAEQHLRRSEERRVGKEWYNRWTP